MEYYKKHRPKLITEVVGQDEVCKALSHYIETKTIPQTVMFYGPSGCGKTTLARILAKAANSKGDDLQEVNCADLRGIDDVRAIKDEMWSKAMNGGTKTWILDEIQATNTHFQQAFLKMCEDTPPKVYFFLATTHPQKLIPTLRNRCQQFEIKPIPNKILQKRLEDICKLEKKKGPSRPVLDAICDHSLGSLRMAIQTLEKVLTLTNEEEQLSVIVSAEQQEDVIKLCRVLLNPRARWPEAAKILRGLEGDGESHRRVVRAYMNKVALGGGKLSGRAANILDCFSEMIYDPAGLTSACYDVICSQG